MNKADFNEEELRLLKTIFKSAEAILEIKRESNDDVYDINTLYNLEQKLGIYEVLL